MSEQIFLSRRHLLVLLSKLDRKAKGDDTACTIIKYRNKDDPFVQTMDSIAVTAVEDADYYVNRTPGEMHPKDEPSRVMIVDLDLSEFFVPLNQMAILTGKENGLKIRDANGLSNADKLGNGVKINVITRPETYSISSSFIRGVFEPSIRLLGRESFYRKYNFENLPRNFQAVVEACVFSIEHQKKTFTQH
jgi:hypothetical protein